MARNPENVRISLDLSPAQIVILRELAGDLSNSAYLRALLASAAQARGFDFPLTDVREHGALGEGRRKSRIGGGDTGF